MDDAAPTADLADDATEEITPAEAMDDLAYRDEARRQDIKICLAFVNRFAPAVDARCDPTLAEADLDPRHRVAIARDDALAAAFEAIERFAAALNQEAR